jgi:hypothetical protein
MAMAWKSLTYQGLLEHLIHGFEVYSEAKPPATKKENRQQLQPIFLLV